MLPLSQWSAYQTFVSRALKYGFRCLFSRKQLLKAFRRASVQNKDIIPRAMLYVQGFAFFDATGSMYWAENDSCSVAFLHMP